MRERDIAKAKTHNQALVRAQRRALGLDEPEVIMVEGYASSTLELSTMAKQPTAEVLEANIERVKGFVRAHVESLPGAKLGVVSAMNLVNGDIEVRAIYSQTMRKEPAH